MRTKVYPIPGAADGALAEFETDEQLRVLDDFHESGYLVQYHEAVLTGNIELFDRLIADQAVYVAERFGKGELLTKTDNLAKHRGRKITKVAEHTRDHVRLRAFGDNAVVMNGNSTSVLTYKGQESRGPRLFAQTYMKLDGRWQIVLHAIMDYDGVL